MRANPWDISGKSKADALLPVFYNQSFTINFLSYRKVFTSPYDKNMRTPVKRIMEEPCRKSVRICRGKK